jgi:hypothetical protein
VNGGMSAIGPKRTSLVAPHMSAFGGKADMTVCGIPLSRSLLGAKRTCLFAAHMSANDPKRTLVAIPCVSLVAMMPCPDPRGGNETARVHQIISQPTFLSVCQTRSGREKE